MATMPTIAMVPLADGSGGDSGGGGNIVILDL